MEFQARVSVYEKGYKGGDAEKAWLNPVRTDYHLSRPTRIRNLTHPEAMHKVPRHGQKQYTARTDKPSQESLERAERIAAGLHMDMPAAETEGQLQKWIRASQGPRPTNKVR